MEFQQLMTRALEIRKQYEVHEAQRYGTAWTKSEIALGFVGDVGDLAKLVIAEGGKRDIPDSKDKLAHELADCLWSVMVLAHAHDIDLENSFIQTMDGLEKHLASMSSQDK